MQWAKATVIAAQCRLQDICYHYQEVRQGLYSSQVTFNNSVFSRALQSLTATRRKQPHPVADLAFNPVDIKNRLSGVTVFTVANNETGEFVLASAKVVLLAACPATMGWVID